jgi:hypothetical protein
LFLILLPDVALDVPAVRWIIPESLLSAEVLELIKLIKYLSVG